MAAIQTTVERRKSVSAFFPFRGIKRGKTEDGKTYLVPEGYSYVNAWVGDGYNLKRSSMMAASDDYMRWGAVREMHQPSAVGTAVGRCEVTGENGATETVDLGVTWDDTGAFLRCKVVDEDAILKLNEGVYKGFSVSVVPRVMRGNDVESCTWIENSLVDRPADPDAVITLIRSDDVAADYEVVRYWAGDDFFSGPTSFSDMIPALEKEDFYSDLSRAWYALLESCRSYMDAGQGCAETFGQFVAYVQPMLTGSDAERALTGDILRAEGERVKGGTESVSRSALAALQTDLAKRDADLSAVNRRLADVEAARTASESALNETRADLERMKAEPDPKQTKPVLIAPDREFMANRGQTDPDAAQVETLRDELAELERSASGLPTQDERRAAVVRMNVLKSQLRERGEL